MARCEGVTSFIFWLQQDSFHDSRTNTCGANMDFPVSFAVSRSASLLISHVDTGFYVIFPSNHASTIGDRMVVFANRPSISMEMDVSGNFCFFHRIPFFHTRKPLAQPSGSGHVKRQRKCLRSAFFLPVFTGEVAMVPFPPLVLSGLRLSHLRNSKLSLQT